MNQLLPNLHRWSVLEKTLARDVREGIQNPKFLFDEDDGINTGYISYSVKDFDVEIRFRSKLQHDYYYDTFMNRKSRNPNKSDVKRYYGFVKNSEWNSTIARCILGKYLKDEFGKEWLNYLGECKAYYREHKDMHRVDKFTADLAHAKFYTAENCEVVENGSSRQIKWTVRRFLDYFISCEINYDLNETAITINGRTYKHGLTVQKVNDFDRKVYEAVNGLTDGEFAKGVNTPCFQITKDGVNTVYHFRKSGNFLLS